MNASVSLGLDNSPFAKAIDQAETKAQSFSSKVGKLLGGSGGGGRSPWDEFTAPIPEASRKIDGLGGRISNLFRRTPERRAETALAQFTANLAGGDVASAVSGLALSISGFGLAAGIAVGGAIEVFSKFKGEIEESNKAYQGLASQLAKPLSLQGALSPEGISKEIEGTSKAADQLIEKRKNSWWARGFLGGDQFGLLASQSRKQTDALAESRTRESKLAAIRAESELRISDIKLKAPGKSEKEAGLAKITTESREKRAELFLDRGLTKPGRDQLDLFKAMIAVNIEEKAAKEELKQQFALKQQEADVEGKILGLKKQGLTAEEQTTAETKLRIASLREQLGLATPEQQKGLQNRITALKQSLPPDLRPPIGVSGETSLGIQDTMTGEWRHELRPQEQANLRAGQMEADARLRGDQLKYGNDLSAWQERSGNYMRGWDQYSKQDLIRPTPPSGYDIDVGTGKVTPREPSSGKGTATPITKGDLDALMQKYWGG